MIQIATWGKWTIDYVYMIMGCPKMGFTPIYGHLMGRIVYQSMEWATPLF